MPRKPPRRVLEKVKASAQQYNGDEGLPQQRQVGHELDVRPPDSQHNRDQCPRKESQEQQVNAPRFWGFYRFIRPCPTGNRQAEDKNESNEDWKY